MIIMSMESALENYPKAVSLKSGVNITLRPLVSTDLKALSAFFKALPSEDLIFLKERISDPKVIRRWCSKIDPGHTLHLLAFSGKKIVGLASLHQDLGGWKRHVGRLNVHTLPECRGKGIGRNLINEIIHIARQSGLMWLEAELFDKQEPAIRMFGLLGFSNLLRLPDYVKDMQSVMHDYILMHMKLITEEEYAGMG
jgi:ribosomal protein S18 acetylase RimI-like enzyme